MMGSSGSVFTLVVSESVNSCRFLAGPTIVLSYGTGSGVGYPWIYFCCCGNLVIEGLERSLYRPWLLAYPEGGLYLSSETDSCACPGDPPGSVGFIEYLGFGFSWKILILNKEAGFLPRCDMESSCSAGAPISFGHCWGKILRYHFLQPPGRIQTLGSPIRERSGSPLEGTPSSVPGTELPSKKWKTSD
ncbi:hypothetical protein F2Q68_00013849 [Brassica cretica]|uniref:Uncharacterized protein n=1 Tax=Brassica cretica TaxID=69181 RepID=A0A8S9HF71_BRACR|nr:hypothetical protein F2Q68_00013849 [Brassica cretica]